MKATNKKKNKLIVIRGNSGCGKSTVARMLQANFPDKKIALVEQDYFRRTVLREKGSVVGVHAKFIKNSVKFLLSSGYDVILEGILAKKLYSEMLASLLKFNKKSYLFYIDVSLEESLRRSEGKSNYHEFGPEKVKSWYLEKDLLSFKNEFIIKESFSVQETLDFITKKTKL
jgi:thymidylate kinase